jgi:2-polyprenyl-6-methoxyphenol hydroxylase-like FAD-dependent oxidoreductase
VLRVFQCKSAIAKPKGLQVNAAENGSGARRGWFRIGIRLFRANVHRYVGIFAEIVLMPDPSILIVGAGPTGMTTAIELKRAGLDVRIIDKNAGLAEHSQALAVQARTLEQFQRYGITDEAVARGRKIRGVRFYSEGKQIVHITMDQLPSRFPYLLFLPQSETEALLNANMESLGVKTERRVELESLVQHDRGVHATLRHPDGRKEDVSVRWLIGCDGAHSPVREKTGTRFEGGGVALSFFLGDLELEGPDIPEDLLSVHTHRGDVVFMGRISDRIVRMIVALHSEQDKDEHRQLTVEDFQQAVDQVGVRVKVISAGWTSPFRVNDRQARRYRIGNVFLAGDASHIHSPVGGQGMNTGIQDAANLAWKLAAVARGADESLLNSYEEERGGVGRALLRFTERGLKMASTTNPLLEGIRDVFVPFISSLKPVQRAVTGFIAETAIEYRSSSIVRDFGGDGDLRAGDRLPDLTLLNPGDQTTLLRTWTDARHLVLVINGSNLEVAQVRSDLPEADVISVCTPHLDDEGIGLLGTRKKVVIVRPDGYVGFRGAMKYRSEWRKYAIQDGLAPEVISMAA